MPIVELLPGKALELNSGDRDEVVNVSDLGGEYELAFKFAPIILPSFLGPHHKIQFKVPEGGATIRNEGKVTLNVITPGL